MNTTISVLSSIVQSKAIRRTNIDNWKASVALSGSGFTEINRELAANGGTLALGAVTSMLLFKSSAPITVELGTVESSVPKNIHLTTDHLIIKAAFDHVTLTNSTAAVVTITAYTM